ncbi:MAG TPA: hypothetical protein VMT97_02970, partial [Terriglobales bacterium]|nr:hypothetical protein [Terriglobales bacterium]
MSGYAIARPGLHREVRASHDVVGQHDPARIRSILDVLGSPDHMMGEPKTRTPELTLRCLGRGFPTRFVHFPTRERTGTSSVRLLR